MPLLLLGWTNYGAGACPHLTPIAPPATKAGLRAVSCAVPPLHPSNATTTTYIYTRHSIAIRLSGWMCDSNTELGHYLLTGFRKGPTASADTIDTAEDSTAYRFGCGPLCVTGLVTITSPLYHTQQQLNNTWNCVCPWPSLAWLSFSSLHASSPPSSPPRLCCALAPLLRALVSIVVWRFAIRQALACAGRFGRLPVAIVCGWSE